MNNKKLTLKQKDKLILDIINYLQQKDLFFMIDIYYNNKRISSDEPITKHTNETCEEKSTKQGPYYITENVGCPCEYSNPKTITMTFEGPLYNALNYGSGRIENELQEIFKKYDLYFEMGYAWSLTAYQN